MKSFLALFILLLLGTSCSPTRRLERLIALHPEFKTPDTLVFHDSFGIPEIRIDTILHFDLIHDSVHIRKDRLEFTIHRRSDSLIVQGKCKEDTIYIERKIPVEKIKVLQTDKIDNLISKIPWIVLGLIFTVILIFLKSLRSK